jgi:subtilase family serine protease
MRRIPLIVAVVVTLSIGGLAGIAGPAGAATRAPLHGSTFRWVRNRSAVGTPATTRRLALRVYLGSRDPAGYLSALQDVTTPGSPGFRHFITPAEYAARFAPSTTQVRSVEQWLGSAGLRVTGVGAGNRYVAATGTIAVAQRAFGTTLREYDYHGRTVTAPATDATVPSSLATTVVGVTGLDDLPHYATTRIAGNPPPPDASLRATPCAQWYGQLQATTARDGSPLPAFDGRVRPWATCGYMPQQLHAAYGADTTNLDGAGTTVGIALWYDSPTQPADVNRFSAEHGWPQFAPGQYSTVHPAKFRRANVCGEAQEEQAIDITAIHDIAPAANVVYYAAASCFDDDLLDTFARIVDDDRVSIVNNSWGGLLSETTSGLIAAYEQVFGQAALQGQSFFFSSGDDGDWTAALGQSDYDFPASDPMVTSVGGTTLDLDGANHYQWEAGWGYDVFNLENGAWVDAGFGGGAGGGIAPAWARPTWQKGVVNAPNDGRAYPDIAADADNVTGIRTGYTQVFPGGKQYAETRWGGTSLASPLLVGETALAQQKAGARIGFANPLIYKLARQGSNAFTDVTNAHDGAALVRVDFVNGFNDKKGVTYSVRTVDDDTSLTMKAGWDDVTGVGTPTAKYPAALARVAG